jgi:hypothetical protein
MVAVATVATEQVAEVVLVRQATLTVNLLVVTV